MRASLRFVRRLKCPKRKLVFCLLSVCLIIVPQHFNVTWSRPRAESGLLEREYITGERLLELCDVLIYSAEYVRTYPAVRKHNSRVILLDVLLDDAQDETSRILIANSFSFFIKTDLIEEFKRVVLPLIHHNFVIVTHNSDDRSGVDDEILKHPYLIRWYGQNMLPHAKTIGVPIGLENADTWGRTDFHHVSKLANRAKTKLLYFQFSDSTNEMRRGVREILLKKGFKENQPKDWRSYIDELSQHRFCVAPPGNGIDTHRAWECIYLGVTPIMLRMDEMFHWFREVDILWVESFEDISPQNLLDFRPTSQNATIPNVAKLSFYREQINLDQRKTLERASRWGKEGLP